MKYSEWQPMTAPPKIPGGYEWKCGKYTVARVRRAVFKGDWLGELGHPGELRPALTCQHCRWRGRIDE